MAGIHLRSSLAVRQTASRRDSYFDRSHTADCSITCARGGFVATAVSVFHGHRRLRMEGMHSTPVTVCL
jgi:hypothetical protein